MIINKDTINKEYLNEDTLKSEIIKLQKRNRLKELLAKPESELTMEEHQEIVDIQETYLITASYKNTKFGEMVYLLVNKLSNRHNFGGYTNNWKDEMKTNAVEKIMHYAINNFDSDMISSRTNKPVKAFAYITQIANNAFVEVINNMKKEQELSDMIVDYQELPNEITGNNKAKVRNNNYIHRQFEKWVDDEKELINSYPRGYVCKNIDGLLHIMVGRDKNIIVTDDYGDLKEDMYIIFNKDNKVLEKGKFTSVYEILKKYNNISFTYPSDYNLSMDEYNKIATIPSKFKNINRYSNTYSPSFPKREKQVEKSIFEDWEVIENGQY